MHVRSHTDLPGFIAEGNRRAGALAIPAKMVNLPDIFQLAKLSHQQFHQNVPGLVHQFHLMPDQSKAIIAPRPSVQRYAALTLSASVNPRGLNSCEVWQMDMTHILQFSRLKYVYVLVDNFSGGVCASVHTGEKNLRCTKPPSASLVCAGDPQRN